MVAEDDVTPKALTPVITTEYVMFGTPRKTYDVVPVISAVS
jgi:hypothetical protein